MADGDIDNPIKNGEKRYNDPETGKFVPGNPGGGRTPGTGISITTEIKKKLVEVPAGQKATYLELLIARILKQAISDGDQQMIKQIWNYIDGMPIQKSELSGPNGEGVQFKIIAYGHNDPVSIPTNALHDPDTSRPAPVPSPQLAPESKEDNSSDQPIDKARS